MEKYLRTLLGLIILIFPAGQLTRITIFSPEIHLHLLDLVSGITIPVTAWILYTKKLRPQPLPKTPIIVFFGALALSLIVNTPTLSSKEIVIAVLYLLRLIAYASLFVVARFVSQTPIHKETFKKNIILSSSILALVALFQYIFYPDMRPLEISGWDPHLYRAVGSFFDPGFLGLILLLSLILGFFAKNKYFTRKVWLVLLYTAFALTYSRASYLAFLVSAFLTSRVNKSWKLFLAILSLFVFTLLILPQPGSYGTQLDRQSTIFARVQNWTETINIFSRHPIFGVGYNTYRSAQGAAPESHSGAGADSSILFTFATSGLVGGLSLLWVIYSFLNYFFKNNLPVLYVSLIAILIHSLFLNSLYYPWVMFWFASVLAIELPPKADKRP